MAEETDRPQVSGKTAPPVAKKRGRPPGSKSAPPDPLAAQPIGPESTARRGRPRKPHIELDPSAIARQVKGLHGFAAMLTGLKELNLTDAEAEELAKASVNFSREFGYEPNPKLLAGLELIGVAGVIYVPRVMLIIARIQEMKAKRAAAQPIEGTATPVQPETDGHSSVN